MCPGTQTRCNVISLTKLQGRDHLHGRLGVNGVRHNGHLLPRLVVLHLQVRQVLSPALHSAHRDQHAVGVGLCKGVQGPHRQVAREPRPQPTERAHQQLPRLQSLVRGARLGPRPALAPT